MSKEEEQGGLVPELRFGKFEGTWKLEPLGPKTLKVGSGKTPKGGDANYKKKGRPFVRSQNIGKGILLLDDIAFIDEELHQTFPNSEIKKEDVLLNITGASIGRCAIADDKVSGGNVNQHVCIIRTKAKKLAPHFLMQYINSTDGQQQIDSFQAGGNREGLNFGQIRSFDIPVPPDPTEQKKIANTLISLDALITAHTDKLAALREHKKGLLQQLFPGERELVPGLRFEGCTEDWKSKKFEDLFTIGSGRDYKHLDKGDVPMYGSGGYMSSVNEYLYDGKSVCIGRKGTINKPMFLSGKFWTVDTLFFTHSFVDCTPEFIYLLFQKIRWLQYNEAGGIPSLSKTIIYSIEVLVPCPDEQEQIVECFAFLDDSITAQTKKIKTLRDHKKGLMQRLFPNPNGKQR
jgi:type I restriction enzyme S subunit